MFITKELIENNPIKLPTFVLHDYISKNVIKKGVKNKYVPTYMFSDSCEGQNKNHILLSATLMCLLNNWTEHFQHHYSVLPCQMSLIRTV